MHRGLLLSLLLAPAVGLAQLEEPGLSGRPVAVQDRAYPMLHEFAFSAGALPADPFTKVYFGQASYTTHFGESFAWQVVRGSYSLPVRSGLREQLERDFEFTPSQFDWARFSVGSDLVWKPIYGKLAAVDRWVVTGEAYVLVGATMFRFAKAFRPAASAGFGLRAFLSKTLSLRVELVDHVVFKTGKSARDAGDGTATKEAPIGNVFAVTVGLGFNFGGAE